MPRKKVNNKEELNEELEIEKELSKDDLTPIQDKVTKLFDDIGTTEEGVETTTAYPEERLGEILEQYVDPETDSIPRDNFPDLITSILEEFSE
jgi:hypothetical protein